MVAEAPPATMASRKFAILLAGHASEYIRNVYGGVACLFKGMLSDPDETWDIFCVVDGIFPSDDELDRYHCFIVTGSRYDAHGSDEWVLKLCELIQKVHEKQKKLLGICFGHQVINRALGGVTGRSAHGWDIGLRKVVCADALLSKPYGRKLPAILTLVKFHQDQVLDLPPGGEVLASSDKTNIEMFALGDTVLGIQGHPEFTEDITLDLIGICSKLGTVQEEVLDNARLSFKDGKADSELFKHLCRAFVKGPTCELECYSYEPVQEALEPCLMVSHTIDYETVPGALEPCMMANDNMEFPSSRSYEIVQGVMEPCMMASHNIDLPSSQLIAGSRG